MTSTLNFDEKKFWIVLFSIVARREAVREKVIERAREPQKQPERRDWRMRTGLSAAEPQPKMTTVSACRRWGVSA
jgi:hypothetical protein